METPKTRSWSELPLDLLESIFKRLTFTDFHRAKIVCSNWNLSSKLTVPKKTRTPWLILFPEEYEDGFVQLYNPEEDRIYKTKRDFSGIRFLGNWGNWFLVMDSQSNLYIIDVFSDNTINLPPLDSLQSSEKYTLKRLVVDKKFVSVLTTDHVIINTEFLEGVLWVDEKTQDYIVVWFESTDPPCFFFCKKGDDHYTNIPLELEFIYDVVLRGHSLYIFSNYGFTRFIDLSGPRGFLDVCWSEALIIHSFYCNGDDCRIFAFHTSGEALLVLSILDKITIERIKSFRVLKKSPNQYEYFEVDSLGDESLLLGSRIFVPGIEPNSIYITSHDRCCHVHGKRLETDICVFNLTTKTCKGFPSLSNMKLKDSRWFLPMI